jgi:hypothetical protein
MPLWLTLRHYFRRYHRLIAFIVALPILLIAVTGTLTALASSLKLDGLQELVLSWHTFETLNVEQVFPLFVGLSVICLTITGCSILPIWSRKRSMSSTSKYQEVKVFLIDNLY